MFDKIRVSGLLLVLAVSAGLGHALETEDDEITVTANVTFLDSPTDGAQIDMDRMNSNNSAWVPDHAHIWAEPRPTVARPTFGSTPSYAPVVSNLSIGERGWDPRAFSVTWDAADPPDQVWIYIKFVVKRVSDPTTIKEHFYFYEWPVPADNNPPVTYEVDLLNVTPPVPTLES